MACTGGWTGERRTAALEGLKFLHLPLLWSTPVRRWAERAALHEALHEVLPAMDDLSYDAPARRRR